MANGRKLRPSQETIARREKVSERLRDGWTFREMATEFGVVVSTIHRDVQAIRKEYANRSLGNYSELVSEDLEALNSLLAASIDRARGGDFEAARLVVDIIRTRSAISGRTSYGATSGKIHAQADLLQSVPNESSEIKLAIRVIPSGNRDLVDAAEADDDLADVEEWIDTTLAELNARNGAHGD